MGGGFNGYDKNGFKIKTSQPPVSICRTSHNSFGTKGVIIKKILAC